MKSTETVCEKIKQNKIVKQSVPKTTQSDKMQWPIWLGSSHFTGALRFSLIIFSHSASPTLSRSHTLCAALQKLEQRYSILSGLCTMDTRGCRIPTPTQWDTARPPLSTAATAHNVATHAANPVINLRNVVSHQVALSEKLHDLMTEIQDGGSDKDHFLLAN